MAYGYHVVGINRHIKVRFLDIWAWKNIMKKRMYFTKILIVMAGLMFHTVISDTN